jgi:hypothetical protein
MNPRGDEAYFAATALTLALRFGAREEGLDDGLPEAPAQEELEARWEQSCPFDRHLRIPWRAATRHPFFVQHYGFGPPVPGGPEVGPEWRRIDDDWLGSADRLALQMDSYTNNTSLVLAFELPRTRKVLLFPGDAQAGNWRSWSEIAAWKDSAGDAVDAATADLLARTVFYKVGHHGSHNATLREGGLEEMAQEGDLVAFVPVSEPVAHEIKGWRKMPLKDLMERLAVLCRGRVVRPEAALPEAPPPTADAALWRSFNDRLRIADTELPEKRKQGVVIEPPVPLFVQYAIAD